MDKYFKIQKLLDLQKERKLAVEKSFLETLGFLPKIEIDFKLQEKMNYENISNNKEISFLIKIKIKDKSSVKFVVNQNKQKILGCYSKIFPKDFLIF